MSLEEKSIKFVFEKFFSFFVTYDVPPSYEGTNFLNTLDNVIKTNVFMTFSQRNRKTENKTD